MNKNDRDITPSSNGEDGERMRERGREREGERRIIPISAARVVGLSNQSVAAPEDGNSAAFFLLSNNGPLPPLVLRPP